VRGASSLNLNERVLLDSSGDLFRVTRAELVKGQRSVLWSMGTEDQKFFVTVAKRPRPAFAEVQRLVLEQIADPRAQDRVKAFKDVPELIEAARESWNWGRE